MRGTNSGIRSETAMDATDDVLNRLFSIHSQFPLTSHNSANGNECIETDNGRRETQVLTRRPPYLRSHAQQ